LISNLVEIKGFDGQGYQPLVTFGTWRVAALRYLDEISPDRINSMERHTGTDEVFLLVHGIGMLVLGGNKPVIEAIETIVMKNSEVYNIKKDSWHNIILSEDAHVIIIENDDTGEENTEHCQLTPDLQQSLQQKANSFLLSHYQ
jgi:hypothetical protein